MPAPSNIAARCVAMSSAIAQIILDATSFARQLRDSRHYINAVNADLLAIKLSLDIARDDFSAKGTPFHPLFVETVSGFLECCHTSITELHKPLIRLAAGGTQGEAWHIFEAGGMQGIRQDLEALRSTLDLTLDVVVFLRGDINQHATIPPAKRLRLDGSSSSPENSVLRRIDVEREHIEVLTEGRYPTLYTSFDKLRTCIKLISEEHMADDEIKRSDSRSDSLEPEAGDRPRSTSEAPPPLPATVESPSGGIGAWISNVLSQKLLSHTLPPDALTLSDPRSSHRFRSREGSRERSRERKANTQSRETFYAESTTSGTQTHSSGPTSKIKDVFHTRIDSSQMMSHPQSSPLQTQTSQSQSQSQSKLNRLTQYTTTTEISIIHQNLTNDKIAIAKDMRNQLTRIQRLTIDRKLRDIPRTITAVNVERIFFEGANPNVAHPEFGTLAIRAAYELPTDVLKTLIDYGADCTKVVRNSYYSTLHAAVLGRQLENLQYLLSLAGPLPLSPLSPSINFPALPTLTITPPSSIIMAIDTPNADGETPLHLAVRTPGAYHIAKWLLEMGADVDREAPGRGSPLRATAGLDSRERSAMVELLMAHGAGGDVQGESAGQCGERRGKGLSILGLI
ncbi:hypothetical protein DM02DRAFT_641257 [Periconia macrospinosa]|uniref:Ankyrin n=1 Tax=Periconia macrospinosa TaxID=97972 RepID=A0A2V1DW15_9PLEO|nr:hypothetical protein DM02DRAFT_641257 [Periconia macrospinosa]